MGRKRTVSPISLPAYVRKKESGYYLEPKGKLKELLGGRSSYPLGRTTFEMYVGYSELMQRIETRSASGVYTMKELFLAYRQEVLPTKSAEHARRMDTKLEIMMCFFGDSPIHLVRRAHIMDYKKYREKDSPIAFNRDLSLLSTVFNHSEQLGGPQVTVNPCKYVPRNKEQPRKKEISDECFLALHGFIEQHDSLLAAYLYLKLITGRRGEEMIRLRKDSAMERGIMFEIVKKRKDEGPEYRIVRWTKPLREAWQRLCKALEDEPENCLRQSTRKKELVYDENRLFGNLTRDAMTKRFERLRNKAIAAGVITDGFRLHDLRSYSTKTLTSSQAQKLLAHSSASITERHYKQGIEEIDPLVC